VRADSDDGTLALQEFDGGDGGADTSIIGDFLSIKGNVDITSDQNLLSLKFGIRKILDGLLGLKLEVESGGTANTEGCKLK